MLTGVALSGGIVGLAGMIKLCGNVFTLSPEITGNAGFTAIIIAWLSNLSAPVIAVVSVLIAALEQGSQAIQIKLQIPAAVASIIQGLILMSALGGEFFLKYQVLWTRKPRGIVSNMAGPDESGRSNGASANGQEGSL